MIERKELQENKDIHCPQEALFNVTIIMQFNSIHLFTCLTTAKYGQLQPSTKTTVQVNIKKQKKT
jgi:hypothetical protein